jgi:hypothetical protein
MCNVHSYVVSFLTFTLHDKYNDTKNSTLKSKLHTAVAFFKNVTFIRGVGVDVWGGQTVGEESDKVGTLLYNPIPAHLHTPPIPA